MMGGPVIGVMSGTSLDGLDLAICTFEHDTFDILHAKTISFPKELAAALKHAKSISPSKLARLDADFGKFIGKSVKDFSNSFNFKIKPIAVASHGHTVSHDPENGYSLQIGSGAQIALESGLQAIVDFRSTDVAAGGQGAPLVPIGDLNLFREYEFCLNLGGIVNISHKIIDSEIKGFDICGCNLILNDLASVLGKKYDEGGKIARSGKVNDMLLEDLLISMELPARGFSLDAAEARSLFFGKADRYELSTEDLLATAVEYIAKSIASVINEIGRKYDAESKARCLVTGGGAHNDFLVERIKAKTDCNIKVPEKLIVDYKEALVFAYMGWLRLQNIPNCLASVTGATKDTIGGAIYLP